MQYDDTLTTVITDETMVMSEYNERFGEHPSENLVLQFWFSGGRTFDGTTDDPKVTKINTQPCPTIRAYTNEDGSHDVLMLVNTYDPILFLALRTEAIAGLLLDMVDDIEVSYHGIEAFEIEEMAEDYVFLGELVKDRAREHYE